MNILKKQRGSITIITLITVLFILAFVLGNFAIVTNRRRIQETLITKTFGYENYEGLLASGCQPRYIYTSNTKWICNIRQS